MVLTDYHIHVLSCREALLNQYAYQLFFFFVCLLKWFDFGYSSVRAYIHYFLHLEHALHLTLT